MQDFYQTLIYDSEDRANIVHTNPVLTTLASIGIIPVVGEVVEKIEVMQRDLSILATVSLQYENELIVNWDIPMMGADHISQSQMSNIQVNGPNHILHGVGSSSLAISACREKLDGVEAIQIVATTVTGKEIAFIWCEKRFFRVTASRSAHYEYMSVGATYFLLSGVPALEVNVRVHPWLMVSKESLTTGLSGEGMILLCNGLEYRLKNKRTVTLQIAGRQALDGNNSRITISELPKEHTKFVEAEWLSPNVTRYIRDRPDRNIADSRSAISTIASSAVLAQLIEKVPSVQSYGVIPLLLHYPPLRTTTEQHRVYHSSNWYVGPYAWANHDTSAPPIYAAQLARAVAIEQGKLYPEQVQYEAMIRGQYVTNTVLTTIRSKDIISPQFALVRLVRKRDKKEFRFAITPMPTALTIGVLCISREELLQHRIRPVEIFYNPYYKAYVYYFSPVMTQGKRIIALSLSTKLIRARYKLESIKE